MKKCIKDWKDVYAENQKDISEIFVIDLEELTNKK